MKSAYKKWTNDEELVVISMRKEGKSIKEIAKQLNRPFYSVSNKCNRLIATKKIEPRRSKMDYDKIGEFVSKNPGNITEGFRQYSAYSGFAVASIANAYYQKKQPGQKIRVKDRGELFTVIGKAGHTINNSKNTCIIKKKNLWQKIKKYLSFSSSF